MHAVGVPVRPSETHRGQSWLGNFGGEERETAALLIDSLQIVDTDTMTMGLKSTLKTLQEGLGGTALLLPVLSEEDLVPLRPTDWISGPGRRPHVAWDTYAPGAPISATPGSEGLMGTVVRDVVGDDPAKPRLPWLHPASDLDMLRDQRCRALVLVTDYSGSGQQVVTFARTLIRNERIRSWRSFQWLRVIVVAYATSLTAHHVIESSGAVDNLYVAAPAASFGNAQWTDSERAAVEALCRKYALGRSDALGFDGSAGLFLTHTFIPNNLPWILRKQTKGWHPFFTGPKGRTFPPDLAADLGSYIAPARDLAKLAEQAKQVRLSKALASGRLGAPADRLIVMLALLAHRTLDRATLSHELGRGEAEVGAMLDWLVGMGFVDSDLRITEQGRAELANARRLERVVTAGLSGTDEPYYPQALR